MKNKIDFNDGENVIQASSPKNIRQMTDSREGLHIAAKLPEILFLTSYPPRECGIATYSQDLIKALDNKFSNSFSLKVCALESGNTNYDYPDEVKYTLDTTEASKYAELANTINLDTDIRFVLVQHEFGFFQEAGEDALLKLLYGLLKPAIVVFHTVLPHPDEALRQHVRRIVSACASVVVMTKNASNVLSDEYYLSK